MTIKENFVLRQVAGSYVVVAVGEASVDFNGMLTLNESGALLWRTLERGADRTSLVAALTSEYEVDEARASHDADEFVDMLRKAGCLAE